MVGIMSIIQDYPCPHCGANLRIGGFEDTLIEQIIRSQYFYKGTGQKVTNDVTFISHHITCGQCFHEINTDAEAFIKMVKKEWK